MLAVRSGNVNRTVSVTTQALTSTACPHSLRADDLSPGMGSESPEPAPGFEMLFAADLGVVSQLSQPRCPRSRADFHSFPLAPPVHPHPTSHASGPSGRLALRTSAGVLADHNSTVSRPVSPLTSHLVGLPLTLAAFPSEHPSCTHRSFALAGGLASPTFAHVFAHHISTVSRPPCHPSSLALLTFR